MGKGIQDQINAMNDIQNRKTGRLSHHSVLVKRSGHKKIENEAGSLTTLVKILNNSESKQLSSLCDLRYES